MVKIGSIVTVHNDGAAGMTADIEERINRRIHIIPIGQIQSKRTECLSHEPRRHTVIVHTQRPPMRVQHLGIPRTIHKLFCQPHATHIETFARRNLQ